MIIFEKYKQNLRVVGNYVISYTTKVAEIKGNELHQLGWWSVTTQKHINYAAKELQLELIKNKQQKMSKTIDNHESLPEYQVAKKVWDDIHNNDTLIYNNFEDYFLKEFYLINSKELNKDE